ncbi:MAG: patatin-like phospholipase family protein [Pseudomonadota bacterium]
MKRALVLSGGGSRGAFQVGVWKYLKERNWQPDIICGTSIGAVNAAAIGSGLDVATLEHLWTTHNRRRIYRLNLVSFMAHTLFRRAVTPVLDTGPMKDMLAKHLDFNALKQSTTRVVISAVNITTARPRFFSQEEIGIEHILASSAMPLLFPWQVIDGAPYWDGGVMVNTPLIPALAFGADEIIVVLLSPIGHTPQAIPAHFRLAGEHLFEQFLSAPYQSALMARGHDDQTTRRVALLSGHTFRPGPGDPGPSITTLAPKTMLGFSSLINFSLKQARSLIDQGYQTAADQLNGRI